MLDNDVSPASTRPARPPRFAPWNRRELGTAPPLARAGEPRAPLCDTAVRGTVSASAGGSLGIGRCRWKRDPPWPAVTVIWSRCRNADE